MRLTLLKVARIIARLRGLWRAVFNSSGQVYVGERVSSYKDMWQAAAREIGARFTSLADDTWEIELGGNKTRILNHMLQYDDPVTLEIASMKPLVYRLLKEQGLPVPEHIVFRIEEYERAYEFLSRHSDGCVIKPANGTSSGRGVTTHITTRSENHRAIVLASLYDRELLMEPMVPGECYRILVLRGQTVHAVCRRAARLCGDGASTVSDLIRAENTRLQSENNNLLKINHDSVFTLKYQDLRLDSVPAKYRVFAVQNVLDPAGSRAEIRTVYNETVTDSICDAVKDAAAKAAAIVGSDFAGVDLITTDATVSLEESGGFINEVNTTPGMHHHYNPQREEFPWPVVQALADLLGNGGSLRP